jgi:hypothetical protein
MQSRWHRVAVLIVALSVGCAWNKDKKCDSPPPQQPYGYAPGGMAVPPGYGYVPAPAVSGSSNLPPGAFYYGPTPDFSATAATNAKRP